MRREAAKRPEWRDVAADAVWAVHAVVTVFFAVAWALPWRWALWSAAIGAPFLHAHWRINDVCVLTTLERRLRGRPATAPGGESGFIGQLLERLLGRPLSETWVTRLTYGVLWVGGAVAALRLAVG